MNSTDAHVLRNILVQMLVNTRTPEPTDALSGAQLKKLKTLYKDLAIYFANSKRQVQRATRTHRYK